MSLELQARQLSLPDLCPVAAAVEQLALDSRAQDRGAVFTRPEVVDFILDLVGYQVGRPLHRQRLLEPAFGGGEFLSRAVSRLLQAWARHGAAGSAVEALGGAIRAVELHQATFDATREQIRDQLVHAGLTRVDAEQILGLWLSQGDFLLAPSAGPFDYIVGNPPYLRQEQIPTALLAAYRERFSTLFDRADLYVPFIEHSLHQLAAGGVLGFICADRWMKNRYGGPLRSLVAKSFHLRVHVDMADADAFDQAVAAYPAISILARESAGPTRVARVPRIEALALKTLAAQLCSSQPPAAGPQISEIPSVPSGDEPWLFEGGARLALVRRLESRFPLLEAAGCSVGIGVATGADKDFIGLFHEMDVEDDCKLPLVMTRDLVDGRLQWRGHAVINPFRPEGGLVDLKSRPRLAAYLEHRRDRIAARHCARKSPGQWYRTIDRIWPALVGQPKLLIPDIKSSADVVFDAGSYYPHHNLYYITSQLWDIRALQAVLLSRVATLFVSAYSTRMRGGFLRFQAQYLRRIRLPAWDQVAPELREALSDAAERHDLPACDEAVSRLYGLDLSERRLLEAEP